MTNQEALPELANQNAAPMTVAPEVQSEKMIPQSEVNKMIGGAKAAERERTRAEVLAEVQKQTPAQHAPSQTMGGMPVMSEADVRRMIQEGTQSQVIEQQRQQSFQNFNSKLSAYDKDRYPDFESKVGGLRLDNPNLEPLVHLAAGVSNTPDVMYDLASNPHKIAQFHSLVQLDPSFNLARQEMHKLSNDIVQNQAAENVPKPNAPLSQIKPSLVSAGNGERDVSSLRKDPLLRR